MKLAHALLLLSTARLYAQAPDCRTPNLPAGTACTFFGTSLPPQKSLGDITFDQTGQQAHLTEPLFPMHGAVATLQPTTRHEITIGGLYTNQTEAGFSYRTHDSDGFKLFADYALSKHLGIEARGTVIRYSVAEIGYYSGKNHTFAATIGPKFQATPLSRLGFYFTPQIGAVHQQYYGLDLGAAAGADLKATKHLSWRVLDAEFRSDQFDPSYRNPRKSRQELGTGLSYMF